MLPTSDALEGLLTRAKELSRELNRRGTIQRAPPALKTEAGIIAREWLSVSPVLREAGICDPAKLDQYDGDMGELLEASTLDSRASALRNKLRAFVEGASGAVVVPLIRRAGSSEQLLARQIKAAFTARLTASEAAYVDEATRCGTVDAFRAAIIMLWAAGIAHLHAVIESRGFPAFNQAVETTLTRRGHPFSIVKADAKVSSRPELQRSSDAPLLVVGMELFGYDLQVYQELARLLGQRNDAAHPGQSQPGGEDVKQFATKLNNNLFARMS
jgi:hypothetical protein